MAESFADTQADWRNLRNNWETDDRFVGPDGEQFIKGDGQD